MYLSFTNPSTSLVSSPSDTVILNPPFKRGCNLPALFLLDDSAQCSCGYVGTYDHDNILENAFIVHNWKARYRLFTVRHALILGGELDQISVTMESSTGT